ncbi:MAG: NAD(P)H-dependent oxidoreductase [Alphaproteobacteria bacterium]|nr:NAD(P)H-dependent oxidoreductase [Alphaproteobacteria bacterium]
MTFKFLGFAGSLRKNSYNRAALRAAQGLTPPEAALEIYDLASIPLYNDDIREKGYPPEVQDFRDKITAADAIVMATPEYNYSISGILKNAIDWASRPPGPPLQKKPVAIIGATQGLWGTVKAQFHLRQMCVFLDLWPLNKPEVLIAQAQNKFDAAGNLTDEMTKKVIAELMTNLVTWTKKVSG